MPKTSRTPKVGPHHAVRITTNGQHWTVTCVCGWAGQPEIADLAIAQRRAEEHQPGSVPGYVRQQTEEDQP